MVVGKESSYLFIDPRDRDAVFKYADDVFGKVFVGFGTFKENKEIRELAARRNAFLRAAGIFGNPAKLGNDTDKDGNENEEGCERIALGQLEALEKALRMNKQIPPVILNIGGVGEKPGALNWNVSGIQQGKMPVPNFLPRTALDADLFAPSRSIDEIFMLSVPLDGNALTVTASEIARLIKPGGTITVVNTVEGRDIHDAVIKAIGEKGTVKQTVTDGILTTIISVKP